MADEEDQLFTVEDYEKRAREILPYVYLLYYSSGRERGWCFKESTEAFSRYRIRNRVLQGISHRSLSTTVLGEQIQYPIGIAPTALHAAAHPNAEAETARGELATSRLFSSPIGGDDKISALLVISGSDFNKFSASQGGAAAAEALMVLSVVSSTTIADVSATAPGGLRWMQTYLFNDRLLTQHVVREAESAGFKALVITVDSPVLGIDSKVRAALNKETASFAFPAAKAEGDTRYVQYLHQMQYNDSATWEDIRWIKSITNLPIVCKGIVSADSAREAADAGVDGILVSAHGGRQSDGVPAPIDALAEVVYAVRGRGIEVYMNGGIRTGTDVFKALGRGARAVFVGRPILWGLACQGSKGVSNILEILRSELDNALANSGCTSPDCIPSDMVVHESYYHRNPPKSKM
ncbi:hydroxyacid oxidase 1-like [Strongylocentrotus purpuratus]|uniref:(S)-2-hydroxy-acid oxidase n=1 Tax=Strongylocentrotus purpuratus TaxID=7668 RepID=A0A7M7NUR8_STRPU|nr:hydroxyacid oxidase 1-like [Strongylocentrotus purpuratus]